MSHGLPLLQRLLPRFLRSRSFCHDPNHQFDTVVRNQAEKFLRDLDVVKREEFEAVKDMARLAREENETLKARIAVLEGKLGISPTAPDVGSMKTDG